MMRVFLLLSPFSLREKGLKKKAITL